MSIVGTPNTLRLWSPAGDDATAHLRIARCLSQAFSSGIWRSTPLPVGSENEPQTALGIIKGLGKGAALLAVSAEPSLGGNVIGEVLGCVVGTVLDDLGIEAYGLGPYGARYGDALLAFIGIVPRMQGVRIRCARDDRLTLASADGHDTISESPSQSLARHLFARWLNVPSILRCSRVYVRTRRLIEPVRHLAETTGFEYRGTFQLDFRGETQDRMVFVRLNREIPGTDHNSPVRGGRDRIGG